MISEKYLQPLKFILVGIVNTIVGYGTMLICYNLLHLNYWLSSAANYIVGSICSFFLNKYFTFRSNNFKGMELLRFVLCIVFCYFVSYGLARPFVRRLLADSDKILQDNIAMVFGTVVFTVLNFFGQKFFVFRKKHDSN